MAPAYTIRRMGPEEVSLAIDWAAAEGWNPGLHDAGAFYSADPDGFLVGELGGRPVACISAVAYDASFGFLGFYIVHPEFRGRGFGLRIWNEAMSYLGDRNIGLDGVPDQQANYARSGFRRAYRNIRYSGQSTPHKSVVPDGITDARGLPFEQVATYDRRFFPAARDAFLLRWLSLPDSKAFAHVEAGAINGYGVIRACRSGFKIGPLFADAPAIADRILVALTSGLSAGTPIVLDVPEPNHEGVDLARRYGLEPVFETARMYTKAPPDLPLAGIFGVATFELG
jgi:GNAT superfamily N-acetyltransferase